MPYFAFIRCLETLLCIKNYKMFTSLTVYQTVLLQFSRIPCFIASNTNPYILSIIARYGGLYSKHRAILSRCCFRPRLVNRSQYNINITVANLMIVYILKLHSNDIQMISAHGTRSHDILGPMTATVACHHAIQGALIEQGASRDLIP